MGGGAGMSDGAAAQAAAEPGAIIMEGTSGEPGRVEPSGALS
jgi:hypothetical protein